MLKTIRGKILHGILLGIAIVFSNASWAQIVGSNNPGESTPREVKPADISGNAYQGDVDLFTGAYSASYPIGSVSTPGGLNYQLSLSYGSSHLSGNTPPHIEGLPYGTGWNINIPTISVDFELKIPYNSNEYMGYQNTNINPATDKEGYTEQLPYNSNDGLLYWHTPVVNIPGVFNGRMVLKELEGNSRSPVFIPAQFERYMELRLDGSQWVLTLDDGTYYEFGLAQKGYRQGLNKRLGSYDNSDFVHFDGNDYSNTERLLLTNNHMPQQEYLQWYCTRIRSKNMASFQGIRFDYEKYGEFNYHRHLDEDYDKVIAGAIRTELLSAVTKSLKLDQQGNAVLDANGDPVYETIILATAENLTDFEAYSDVYLKQMVSYEYFSDIERVKLNYKTKKFTNHHEMLVRGEAGVHAKDSLYNYKSVYYQGNHNHNASNPLDVNLDRNFYEFNTGPEFYPLNTSSNHQFSGWKRYLHRLHNSVQANYLQQQNLQINDQNPYIAKQQTTNKIGYVREGLTNASRLEFNHGYLESGGITSGIVPGDKYEIRTLVNGTSHGEGSNKDKDLFLFDINIKADQTNYTEPVTSWIGGSALDFIERTAAASNREIPVYSTFQDAIKWGTYDLSYASEEKARATSNFFTMPYLAGSYDLKIQVGPSNSDHDLSNIFLTDYDLVAENTFVDISGNDSMALSAYAANRHSRTADYTVVRPSANINQHFGMGLPWNQTRHLYEKIVLDKSKMYDFWWNLGSSNYTWENEPTLAGPGVYLDAVELIRYSKNTYLLDNVETWKLNGESSTGPNSGWTISQKLQINHENRVKNSTVYYMDQKTNYNTSCSLTSQQEFTFATYTFPNNIPQGDHTSNQLATKSQQITNNAIVLTGIVQLPINPLNNRASISANEIAVAPTTHFDYTDFYLHPDSIDDYMDSLRLYEMKGWKVTPLLTKITSHLGGETEINYHEYLDPETHYLWNSFDFSAPGVKGSVLSTATQITNPVKNVRVRSGETEWQQTDYEYSLGTKIQDIGSTARFQVKVGPWQNGSKIETRSGFGLVKVIQPELNGIRPYALHHFYHEAEDSKVPIKYCNGSSIITDSLVRVSTAVNFLYGKLKRTEQYSHAGFKLSETSMDYAVNKAYEGAIKRPFNYKFGGVKTDYFDYRITSQIGTNNTNDDIIDIPFSGHPSLRWPKYMNHSKMVEYDEVSHDAYFIKKIKETTTEYGTDVCNYAQVINGSGGYVNPILTDNYLKGRIQNSELSETTVRTDLMRAVPLADDVLETLILRSEPYSNELVKDVLISQPDLSNATLMHLIQRNEAYHDQTIRQVFLSVPFAVGDSIFDSLYVYRPEFNGDYFNQVKEYNSGLPDRVPMSLPTDLSQSYTNTATNENAEDLQSLISNAGESASDNANALIAQSPLNDELLDAVIYAEGFEPEHKLYILAAQPDLSDDILLKLLDNSESLQAENVTQLFRQVPHVVSTNVMLAIANGLDKYSSEMTLPLLLEHPYLAESVNTALISNSVQNRKYVSQNFYNTLLGSHAYLSEQNLMAIVTMPAETRFDGEVLEGIFATQATYPTATLLEHFYQYWSHYGASTLQAVLTHPKALLSYDLVQSVKNDPGLSLSIKDLVEGHYFNMVPYKYTCNTVGFGADELAITSITEYEYYDAEPDGTTTSPGYQAVFDEYTQPIELAFDPSWQVYSTKSYSPQYPGAYQQNENYYYFDLYNRYNPNDEITYAFTIGKTELHKDTVYWKDTVTVGGYTFYIDTMDVDTFYSYVMNIDDSELASERNANYPDPDDIVGARLSRKKSIRNIPYQVRSLKKNNLEEEPEVQSQYLVYHSEWNESDDPEVKEIEFSGPPCPVDTVSTHPNPMIQAGCSWYKYPVQEIPYGYVVYYTEVPVQQPVYYLCPCGAVDNTITMDTIAPVAANPIGLTELVLEGKCLNDLPDWQDPSLGGQVVFSEFAFKDLLAFHQQQIQLDTIVDTVYANIVTNRLNRIPKVKLMEFEPTTGFQVDTTIVNLPYDALQKYSVWELNRWGQPQLTSNENDLYTRYHFDKPYFLYYSDPDCRFNNYSAVYNSNIGVPNKIVEGASFKRLVNYGASWHTIQEAEPDSLVTLLDYNIDYSLNKIIEPNQIEMKYSYDYFGRLKYSYRNGEMITFSRYSIWDNDESRSFFNRSLRNWVETSVFNEWGNTNKEAERVRKWVDPMGRDMHTASTISPNPFNSSLNTYMVHSGRVYYDTWNRPYSTKKPFVKTFGGAHVGYHIRTTSTNTAEYPDIAMHTGYEEDQRSRPTEIAPYGHTLGGAHNKHITYETVNGLCMACDLSLSSAEVNEMMPFNIQGYVYNKVTTTDEDGKSMTEYTNAIGQKVATRQMNGSHKVVTLFLYDNGGRVRKVIHPNKLNSQYDYNLMGWLYRKVTPDAGRERFMYNKSGLVAISFDQNNANADEYFSHAQRYWYNYRLVEYDRFNRPLLQSRQYFNQDVLNSGFYMGWELMEEQYQYHHPFGGTNEYEFIPSHSMGYSFLSSVWLKKAIHFDTLYGRFETPIDYNHRVLEKEWQYSTIKYDSVRSAFDQADLYPVAQQMGQQIQHAKGKLVATLSYADDFVNHLNQTPREISLMSYNAEGHPDWLLRQFNAAGIGPQQRGSLARITYPEYTLRGGVQTQNIDINADGILDFQYHYQYDGFNRLKKVYANIENSKASGNLLATYEYNDAYGLLTKTIYSQHCNDAGEGASIQDYEVDQIVYEYDDRDRLEEIDSKFFDYSLFYDATNLTANGVNIVADNNYNGNINGIKAEYHLGGFSNTPGSSFTAPTWYGYQYDGLNRLTNADGHVEDWATSNAQTHLLGDVALTYGMAGNIHTLKRYTGMNGATAQNENWAYLYQPSTNRLSSVNGIGGTTTRYYQYDGAGNLTNDSHRNLNQFDYGRANLPFTLYRDAKKIDYLYDVNDSRIYKDHQDGSTEYYLRDASGKEVGVFDMDVNEWTWYVHGAERFARYKPKANQQPSTTVASTVPSDYYWTYHTNRKLDNINYYVHDHLGNTRLNYNVSVDGCSIADATPVTNYTLNFVGDYFPYGKVLREFSSTPKEKYLTTHHERDQETGLDYRGARFYDSDIAKFLSLDPAAMEYPSLSDYTYVADNPVIFVDPDGKRIVVPNEEDRKAILSLINLISYDQYKFDKNGVLQIDESKSKFEAGSKIYSEQINSVLTTPEDLAIFISDVYIGKNGTKFSVDDEAGGGVTITPTKLPSIMENNGKVKADGTPWIIISGNENFGLGVYDGPEMILMHELVGHAIPIITKDTGGNAVENENEVRKELQYPLRNPEPNHKESDIGNKEEKHEH